MWLIGFLSTFGVFVTSELSAALIQAAVMARTTTDGKGNFKSRDGEGTVKAERHSVSLGNFSGSVFSAEIESELGRGKTRFILDDDYLALGEGIREEMGDPISIPFDKGQQTAARWN